VQPRGIALLALPCLVLLCCAACAQNQSGTKPQTSPAEDQATQLNAGFDRSRIVKLRGLLRDHDGEHLSGAVGVLFAIYEQKEGGAPVWQEAQNVEADMHGRFAALVGSTNSEGIPPELFGAEKTRWLGMQVLLPGEVEQPRIRLVRTDNGLMAQRATRLVIPERSGEQAAAAESQEASNENAGTQQDDQTGLSKRPRRARKRFD
jgi:hypothetical protein